MRFNICTTLDVRSVVAKHSTSSRGVFTYAMREIRRSRLVILLLAQEMETLKFVELTRHRSVVVMVEVDEETAALPEESLAAVSLIGYDNTIAR